MGLFMLFMCLVTNVCRKKSLSLLFETWYDAEINLLVCKQRRFVEQAVIRVQMYFHPTLSPLAVHTHIVGPLEKKLYER